LTFVSNLTYIEFGPLLPKFLGIGNVGGVFHIKMKFIQDRNMDALVGIDALPHSHICSPFIWMGIQIEKN